MTTILVTGGAGFIGSNFIDWIHRTREDICVVNLDKLTYAGDPANLEGICRGSAYHFVQGDICDAPVVEGIFREYDIDAVFHFAAESHVDRSIRDSAVFVRTNVLGTQTLLEAARQTWEREDGSFRPGKRFLYVSTDEVYGSLEADEAPSRETSFCRPNNPYAASKAAGDLLVSSYIHTYGFPANVTHCGNNYGPRQHREKFLPTVIRNLLEGKEIPVYGDGRNIRDWIYVEDHVRALEMIWEKGKPGEIYNIGASCERQNLEMIREVCQVMEEEGILMPSGGRITFVEDRKGHDRRYALDPEKIRQLGWRPKTGLRDGLQKTVEWYLK